MIVTDAQRRWWFATHPEFSSSRQEALDSSEEEDDAEGWSPEEVDAAMDNTLQYADGPFADFLRSIKRNFGTEGYAEQRYVQVADNTNGATLSDVSGGRAEESSANKAEEDKERSPFAEAVLERMQDVFEAWGLFALTNPSRKLARNMIKDGRPKPEGHAAHHIVPPNDGRFPEAIEARKVLEKFGIRLDSSPNGVWLPYQRGIGEGAYHPAVHNGKYYRQVERTLRRAKTKEAAIRALKRIGRQLSKGKFPK